MSALAARFGWRYLRARKRNQFVSFVSLSSMLGIAIGMMVLITVLSVMNGFGDALRQRILGTVPHLVVSATPATIAKIEERVRHDPEVTAAAPFFQAQGMLMSRGVVIGVGVFGIDAPRERALSIVPEHMQSGSLDQLARDPRGVVLGAPLAYRLGVQTGDSVSLLVPAADGLGGVSPQIVRLNVAGTFAVQAEVDYTVVLVNWQMADEFHAAEAGIFGVRARLKDALLAGAVAGRLKDLGRTDDWTHRYGELFAAVAMEKVMMGVLLTLVVAIASFNVVSSLVMLVDEKRGDIAVLRTMGAGRTMISRIFLAHGALVAVGGVVLGTLAGVWLAHHVTALVRLLEDLTGIELLAGTYFNEIPSTVRVSDVVAVQVLGVWLCVVAMIYPARRAAAIDPVQALHRE